jgi:hypothetical protein
MKDQFKFIIEKPLRKIDADGKRINVHIHAKYPHLVYPIDVDFWSDIAGHEDRIRLAIAELKVQLIQEISSAEFEYSK